MTTGYLEMSPGVDFYQWVNHEWLTDPNIVIPPDYSQWGSFVQLRDESINNQIDLLERVASFQDHQLSEDEKKLSQVWKTSLQRFNNWDKDMPPDYSGLEEELFKLNAHMNRGDLAEYFAYALQNDIELPFTLGRSCSLEDSNNELLFLAPSGLSMPSRSYYLDPNLSHILAQFSKHLKNVVDLLPMLADYEGFEERVIRFESKLACITMSKEQQRRYDQFYTIVNISDIAGNCNILKSLKEKEENFPNQGFNCVDHDMDIVTEKQYLNCLTDSAATNFLGAFYAKLDLFTVMENNFKKHYPDITCNNSQQFRLMTLDGDYIRRALTLILRNDNIYDLRAYLAYQVILSVSQFVSKELDEEMFDFYQRKLNGQKEQQSPAKRSVRLVNSWIGDSLGKAYVKNHFSSMDKKVVHGMIDEVVSVMNKSIATNDWLTDYTKENALEKLSKFKMKIGFPEKWKDYSELVFENGDSLLKMNQRVSKFILFEEILGRINSPKDKSEWEMTPQTVNAYFNPFLNEIVFPAGIIQPPFYHRLIEDISFKLSLEEEMIDDTWLIIAANFGGIVAVIAHEITHGYDDQGKKFSGDGILKLWWTAEDDKLFSEKTKAMIKQAGEWTFIEPEKEPKIVHHMNGNLTLGENLADLGGLSLAVQAFCNRMREFNCPEKHREILLRVFFKSWANIWRIKQTPESVINRLAIDPHGHSSFRGNAVKNIDEFYEAFDVVAGSPMYLPPKDRVKMW